MKFRNRTLRSGHLRRAPLRSFRDPRLPAIAEITAIVADETGLTVRDLCSPSRRRHFFRARAIAMRIALEATGQSTPRIGRAFGRDHTTVLYAIWRLTDLADGDPDLRARIDRVRIRVDAIAAARAAPPAPPAEQQGRAA